MQVDGKGYEKAFPHPEGITGPALNLLLHQKFMSWLLSEFPSYEADGCVTHIAFTDRMRERIPLPSPIQGAPSMGDSPA